MTRVPAVAALVLACLATAAGQARGSQAPAPGRVGAADRSVAEPRPDPAAALEVPGGVGPLARALGADADRSRARLFLTAIRLLWDVPDGVDPAADKRHRDGLAYLAAIAAFERARTACGPAAVSLAGPRDDRRRRGLRALADALGADLGDAGAGWRLGARDTRDAIARRAWLESAGVPANALLARLNAGEPVSLDRPVDTVPLPWSEASWRGVLNTPEAMRGAFATAILGDRRAALMYYGAVALDPDARLAVGSMPLSFLYNDLRAATFASFGRSLRVGPDGRVAVPGGADAGPLWEAVVDAPVRDITAFVGTVLGRDDGRMALLYDGLAHLEPAAQTWVLGRHMPDRADRVERFRALMRSASSALAGWNPRLRPFERVAYDAVHLFARVRMAPDGLPAGPRTQRFWEVAFRGDDLPDADADELTGLETGDPADAAWWLDRAGVTNAAVRRDRAETWLFAQRVFPSPATADLPDVVVAVRGFRRLRTLALTLERVGVTSPATYVRVMRAADSLSRADGDRAWTTIALFQSALACIERARFARAIDASAAERLVLSLVDVRLTNDRDYAGSLATWLERHLIDAAGPPAPTSVPVDPDRPVERRLLALMAGAVAGSPFGDRATMPLVEWEGLRYRIDPAESTLVRSLAVRERQRGPSLDTVLALAHAAAAVSGAASAAQARGAEQGLTAALAALADVAVTPGAGPPAPDPGELLKDVRGRLRDLRAVPTKDDLERAVRDVRRAVDWYLARALVSIVYAPHLGDADSPALLAGDPSRLHDFGLRDTRLDVRLAAMWGLPAEQRDPQVGWRVGGSLLGLDVALVRFALRRVPSEIMPSPPSLTDIERQALSEPVALASPFDFDQAALGRLVRALQDGRARVAAAPPGALADVARAAGVDEWRAELLPWLARQEPDRLLDEWSLAELVRLGLGEPAGPAFDPWGVSDLSADGAWRCRFPDRQPWALLAGRKSVRIVAALVPDLAIRTGELLVAHALPARLAAGVLSVAVQDLLDTVRTLHEDDWLTLVAQARQVTASRLEDYVAALTMGGPLIPADGDDE